MNFDTLGNIGEFVGALGVIASLVYLAVQVRQNTASVRAATFQALAESYSDFSALIGRDAEVARILQAGSANSSELPRADQFRFHFLMIAATRRWENAFYQHERSMLDTGQWKGLQTGALRAFDSPGGRAWWEKFGTVYFSEAFCKWVESSLQELATQRTEGVDRADPWT